MAAPANLTFSSWRRSPLFDRASRPAGAARLQGELSLTLSDSPVGKSATGTATFVLMGAADIAGLKPTAIKHMAPSPFARDAETTKLVHVDFFDEDLPWRYSPEAKSDTLRPWLVLLVGTAREITVQGGIVTAAPAVFAAHPLGVSYRWAHSQWDGRVRTSRIVSPRGLEHDGDGMPLGLMPQSEYVAALVPAFNDAGEPMWLDNGAANFGGGAVLPAFSSWRFWTADAGDFKTLAAALHIPPAGDVGKSRLRYLRSPEAAGVIDVTLEARGAITSLKMEDSPQAAEIAKVRADLELLATEQLNTIGLPHYGRPWLAHPEETASGWPAELDDDPRYRGTAGLGAWMGIEAQEALMQAAVAQAGALRVAGQRVSHLATGLLASARLWDRRISSDPSVRLRILGPMMSRIVADDGGIVLDRVTGETSPIEPALFSSAAQRILRDRSGPTRHLADAGIVISAAFAEANQPEIAPEPIPDGLPHLDAVARKIGLPDLIDLLGIDDTWVSEVSGKFADLIRRYEDEYESELADLVRSGATDEIASLAQRLGKPFIAHLEDLLREMLSERDLPCESGTVLWAIAADNGRSLVDEGAADVSDRAQGRAMVEAVKAAIRRCMTDQKCDDHDIPDSQLSCEGLVDLSPAAPQSRTRPIDLGLLSDGLASLLDPRKPGAPARGRVTAQFTGLDLTRLIPPEFDIGLNFPTWGLLKQYDQEWLLPGSGELENDSVTALQTNPKFIDAFMIGINTQFLAEMRWRDLAVARTATPLQMFWGQVDYATHARAADITPFTEWTRSLSDPLGALSHQAIAPSDPTQSSGSRLIIAIHSDIFRRYPKTLVYLVKPDAGATDAQVDTLLKQVPDLDRPDGDPDPVGWRADRKFFGPTFAGTLAPDLNFFAFDVTPEALDLYWLVLDEPPNELRFRNDRAVDGANAAQFANTTIDQPTRVALSGKALETEAKAAIPQ